MNHPPSSGSGERGAPADLTPPEDMICGGGPEFQWGELWVRYFDEVCRLKPDERVLDVGCGSGRVAIPLSRYLTAGHYEGFDASAREVEWCQEHVTPVAPNFHFRHVNIFNKTYNPGGTIQPGDLRFPFRDAEFDFVFLTSIFTHMLPEDVEHYLSEIGRVLKPDGRCLATFFLLNAESLALMEEGKSAFDFEHDLRGYRVVNPDQHEDAIAYPEDYVLALYERSGFVPSIDYGLWVARTPSATNRDAQDVVLAGLRDERPDTSAISLTAAPCRSDQPPSPRSRPL